MMHLRKWLRILINRSLVLGTIDRPSVHDLVLDFAVAQHTDDQLREGHRRVVEAFRASRPEDVHGRRKFDRVNTFHLLTMYVCTESTHHLVKGWTSDMINDQLAIEGWLGDVPQDELVVSAGEVLGVEKLSALARRAERASDFWLAGRYWAVASKVWNQRLGMQGNATDEAAKSVDLIEEFLRISAGSVSAETLDCARAVQLQCVQAIAIAIDLPTLLSRLSIVEQVLNSKAAAREPADAFTVRMLMAAPSVASGQVKLFGKEFLAGLKSFQSSARSEPDELMRRKCRLLQFGFTHLLDTYLIQDNFDWDDCFGRSGVQLIEAARNFDFGSDHAFLQGQTNMDDFTSTPGSCHTLIVHYGDMKTAQENAERSLRQLSQAIGEHGSQGGQAGGGEGFALAVGLPMWAMMFYICETPATLQDHLAGLVGEFGLTWSAAESVADASVHQTVRKRDDRAMNVYFSSAEELGWLGKCAAILVSADNGGLATTTIMQALPGVDELTVLIKTGDTMHGLTGIHTNGNVFLMLAAVCDKLGGHPEDVLLYAAAALESDITKAGNSLPTNHVQAQLMRGRAYFALGRTGDAITAFEAAAELAHRYGLWFYEVLVCRDLKQLALDPLGHSEHGSRRLGAALRQLVGPSEMLTPLLKGLDANELMALPAPDAGYIVVCEAEDHTKTELVAELSVLKLKALKKRAREEGVSEELIEDADDADDIRSAVMQLILNAVSGKPDPNHETREALKAELADMKLTALKKRAKSSGVTADRLDDADDADDVRSAVIELIITTELDSMSPSNSSPHEQQQELRSELQAMRLRELRKRARDSGVDADALEETTSASDQKGAVIALLLEHTAANAVADTSSTAHLHTMSLKDVRALAREAGVDEDALEDTMDMEDPKGAVVALIVAAKSVVRSDRPHFGSRSSPSQSSEQGKPKAASTHQDAKHVMLSYQWDHQTQVSRVHDLLTKLGCTCWMDIHGGMGTDVYGSMAEGVSNASVVVCFMSQAYQDSPNCRLELQFAKQSGVEIIPVMMEGSGWRASGWLGLLTAGSLWTRMSDESSFEENVSQVHSQIQKVVGVGVPDELET
eukprot:COSAG06_NODE_5849_length_3246_cov_5.579600_1_plen_1082_part_11